MSFFSLPSSLSFLPSSSSCQHGGRHEKLIEELGEIVQAQNIPYLHTVCFVWWSGQNGDHFGRLWWGFFCFCFCFLFFTLNSLQSAFLGGKQFKMQNKSKKEVEVIPLRAALFPEQAKAMPQLCPIHPSGRVQAWRDSIPFTPWRLVSLAARFLALPPPRLTLAKMSIIFAHGVCCSLKSS